MSEDRFHEAERRATASEADSCRGRLNALLGEEGRAASWVPIRQVHSHTDIGVNGFQCKRWTDLLTESRLMQSANRTQWPTSC
ncbi:hypothetical protein FH063_003078 [Azospirillum argentinense]|uniref:Uncharacterized protein n=1 Tax=Azospirillum argentinense TaxID=2970906 RepID=A0A5B0KLR1_9PROT|nr:hypothetical protein FH063_003078 [Azospirillum argentinense]